MAQAVRGSDEKDRRFIAMLDAMEAADDNMFQNQTMPTLKRCWVAIKGLEMRCVPQLITKTQQSWGAAKAREILAARAAEHEGQEDRGEAATEVTEEGCNGTEESRTLEGSESPGELQDTAALAETQREG